MTTRSVSSAIALMTSLLLGCSGMPSMPSISVEAPMPYEPNSETSIYTITPDPKYAAVEYNNIDFQVGDVVAVEAEGCVDTGGKGKTWKRYKDPEGPNSDRLYHGLIAIPGAMEGGSYVPVGTGLVRLQGVAVPGKTFTIGKTPHGKSHLWLGFEDDNFGDNGFGERRDQGTGDQCKGQPDAFVRVTVRRNTRFPQRIQPSAPFDLASPDLDDNGFLFNPKWAMDKCDSASPQCHKPLMQECFPYKAADQPTNGVEYKGPKGANGDPVTCTTQAPSIDQPPSTWRLDQLIPDLLADLLHRDLHSTIGVISCAVGAVMDRPVRLFGHANWVPVTYEGGVSFKDKAFDQDYDLEMCTASGWKGIEFNSNETVNRFKGGWWAKLRGLVDARTHDAKQNAMKFLENHYAIVTGLMGLDCEHECHDEIHPAFVVAVLVESKVTNKGNARERLDNWAIFVRQQGDEGWCSRDLHRLGLGELVRLRLPQTGAQSVEVDDRTKFTAREGSLAWWSISDEVAPAAGALGAGAVLTFRLPPDPADIVRGDLWLKWHGDDLPDHPPFEESDEGQCTPNLANETGELMNNESALAGKFRSQGDRDSYDAALAVSVEDEEQVVPRLAHSANVPPLVLSAPTNWRGKSEVTWDQRRELRRRSDALKTSAPYILEQRP